MVSTSPSRSHGEGSIYRSDYMRPGSGVTVERWIASVDLGVGSNGKRRRKRITGPTRKAVADKLRKLQRQQDAGVDVRKKSITVADLANEWLTHLEQNEGLTEEGTILRLRPRVERHIIPVGRIGGRQLDQLTVAHIEAWLRSEAESGGKGGKPQAKATCRDYKQMLGEMLEWAVARRYLTWNPARLAKLPKDRSATNPDAPSVYSTSRAKRSFTRDQYAAVMRALTATGSDAFTTATPNAYFATLLSVGAAGRDRCAAMGAGRHREPDDHHRPCDQASGRRRPDIDVVCRRLLRTQGGTRSSVRPPGRSHHPPECAQPLPPRTNRGDGGARVCTLIPRPCCGTHSTLADWCNASSAERPWRVRHR